MGGALIGALSASLESACYFTFVFFAARLAACQRWGFDFYVVVLSLLVFLAFFQLFISDVLCRHVFLQNHLGVSLQAGLFVFDQAPSQAQCLDPTGSIPDAGVKG